jgi:CRP-like cAMP-binding protein
MAHAVRPTKAAGVRSHGGNAVANTILLGLPKVESDRILKDMEFIELPASTILNDAFEPIERVYFINSGLASFLNIMEDGRSVEVGLCGKEGFVGMPVLAGFKTSQARVVMQVGGSAFCMSAKAMLAGIRHFPTLLIHLNRFALELALQGAQVAACNRLHGMTQRLSRWLLMSQDRLGGDLVPLTQEYLAHMLATRRASVTVAAHTLQRKGIISYTRGQLKIVDRAQLEQESCECYEMLTRQTNAWRRESK